MNITENKPVSNADALAKYGRAHIMRKAHAIWKYNKRGWNLKSFGEALARAWSACRLDVAKYRENMAKRAASKNNYFLNANAGPSDYGQRFGKVYSDAIAAR